MIPKIIHYCWFGRGEMPELVQRCIASWHQFMPDWQYMCWSEDNFAIASAPQYVREAYEACKYAFVSDYVRLWALEQYGGVYLDTDVEVIQPFDTLLDNRAFIGFEESKAKTLGTNVIGSESHLSWLMKQMDYYNVAQFICLDGTMDMTPNSEIIASNLVKDGLIRNGKEQIINYQSAMNNNYESIHVYDFHYFSPITSTRVMRKNKHTFSIHHCYGSWIGDYTPRELCNSIIVREVINALIQFKRFIIRT